MWPVLELNKVSRTFQQGETKVVALQGISLTLAGKTLAALTGPSGSGKSTLLNIIGTLDTPDHGQIYIDGKEIDFSDENKKVALRRNYIGFIFQTFNLVPVLTALENVEISLYQRNMKLKSRQELAADMLKMVGLSDRLHHRPKELSGGQQQRVAIARALVGQPKLVLADEPTANLDSFNAFALLDLVFKLKEQLSTTFLFSTHDHRLLDRIETRYTLEDGRLIP